MYFMYSGLAHACPELTIYGIGTCIFLYDCRKQFVEDVSKATREVTEEVGCWYSVCSTSCV